MGQELLSAPVAVELFGIFFLKTNKMILGLIIGFTAGSFFSIACSGITRGLYLYMQIKADGRLVSVKEAERLIVEGATVFLIRDQILFQTLLLPKEIEDQKIMSPQELCQHGLMLNKMLGSRNFLRKKFPNLEVQDLLLMHFS